MTNWLFGRDRKGPQDIPFCPIKPLSEQYISEDAFRQRRDAATEAEMGRLRATPEYRQWAARRRGERIRKALTSASTLRAFTMLVIAGAAFWAGHFTPPGALPELLQPNTAPAEPSVPLPQPNSKLLLQLETERNLAQAYSSRVEKLSARIASLQSEHNTELQRRLGQHHDEMSRRDKQLKDLEARAASDSKAERTRSEQAERVDAKALAEAHAEQAQMRGELERLQKRLTRAQEVNPPTSVLSATNLAIILVLLLATSAATFWISADRYAKEQLQEIENLRLEAEAREAKLILEKSMIGRLQNELVRVNSQVGELDTQLERLKRAEAECERLQTRVADLESGRESANSSLSAARSKVAKLSSRLKEREEQLSEAQDCYSKLDAIYQAEKADSSAALSSKEKEMEAVRAQEQAQHQQQLQKLTAQGKEVQAQHAQEVRKLEDEVEQLQAQRQQDAEKLQAEVEQLQSQCEQELQEVQTTAGMAQAEHEQRVEALEAEVKRLRKNEEMSSVLVKDMQKQIDEYAHIKSELETEVKRLQALVRLEKDTVLALQQALEETKQSWGASESEANTALATSHSFEEEVENLRMALADSDALLEERSQAMSLAHAKLEDKHKDTLFGLRQTQDKVRSLETLVRQQECEAERNADSIREYLQQIDTLQVRIADQQEQLSRQQQNQQQAEARHTLAVREFEAQLADRQEEALALERENENLEGQAEQLTISLMDATSKKTDSELRLRQFQQELVEMEMLMARAEAERAALERELRAMRCTASEAASHLNIAEEELRRESSGGGSPDSAGQEAQSDSAFGSGAVGPVQTPITTALGLMHKMEGVARLLGGSETPNYTSPAPKSCSSRSSQRPSPTDGQDASRLSSALKGSKDHTVRAIEFAPLTSGNLGRLQAEDEAREQGSPQGSPPHSPVRIARQTLAALDAAGAAVSSQVHLSEEMERALQQQDALFSGLDRAKQSTSADGGPELTALHASMHSAFRALASHTAGLTEVQQRAAGAAQAAQRADDAFVAAQELVQSLREQSSAAEGRLSAATSHVEDCLAALAASEAANKVAQEAMKEFEAKGLGSFGGGPESKQAWRNRVEAQDAYSAAAVAKAAAMQAREQAVLTKRALLAQLEAAIPAVHAEEASASGTDAACQEALKDLEEQAKAALEAQTAFLDAKAAFSVRMSALSPEVHLEVSGTSADDSSHDEHLHSSAGNNAHAQPSKDGTATVRLTAESHASSASLLAPHDSPGVSHISAKSADSPGSVENQPQHANLHQDRLQRQGSFKGLLGSLSFNKRAGDGAKSSQIRPDVGKLRAKSESGAVLGERRISSSNITIAGSRRSTDALALLDTAWFSHSGAFD